MVNSVEKLDGPLGASYEVAKEGNRGHPSLWRDKEGTDLPNPGGGEGTEQEGTCLGSGLDSCGVLSI